MELSLARLFQIVAEAQPVGPPTFPCNKKLVGNGHIWDSPMRDNDPARY